MRSVRYSDHDRVVTFFSRDEGLLSGFARGANGPGNRFGAALEPLSRSYLIGRHHVEGTLYRIHKASLIDSFGSLRDDLERMYWAGAAVRLLLSLLPPQHPEQPLFDSGIRYLEDLGAGSSSPSACWLKFASRALVFLGYGVHAGMCHRCQEDASERAAVYHPSDGRIFCRRCSGKETGDGIRTEPLVLKFMERWGKDDETCDPARQDLVDHAVSFVDSLLGHHVRGWIPVRSLPVSLWNPTASAG